MEHKKGSRGRRMSRANCKPTPRAVNHYAIFVNVFQILVKFTTFTYKNPEPLDI